MGTISLRTRLLSTLFVLIALAIGTVKGQSEQIPSVYYSNWSRDGSTLAIATHTELTIYNADFSVRSTWQRTNHDQLRSFYGLSPDGDRIVTTGEVWNTYTFQPLFVTSDYYLGAWSNDGGSILAVPLSELGFMTLSIDTGEVIQSYIVETYSMNGPLWSPDNQYFVGSDNYQNIYLVDGDTSQQIFQVPRTKAPFAFAWHPDSNMFVFVERTGEVPDLSSTVFTFDIQTHQVAEMITLDGYVTRIRWNPTGNQLAVDTTNSLYIVNTVDLNYQIHSLPIFTNDIMYSPWGGQILLSYNTQRNRIAINTNMLNDHDFYISHSLMDGAVQIVVPDPSLDRLNAIAQACDAVALTTQPITDTTLPAFIAQIESLPADAIPPACRADLLAVAHALRAP